jgi:hypothetical protein
MHFHQNPRLRPAEIQQPSVRRKPAIRQRKPDLGARLRRALWLGGSIALYGGALALSVLWGWWMAVH